MSTLQVRIEPKTKKLAETILDKIGMSPGEAVRILYKQIILQRAFPVSVSLPREHAPNAETAETLRALDRGAGEVVSLDDFKKKMLRR